MSEAEEMVNNGYGCSCHSMPPCSFCTSMTEEEANIFWNEGMYGLEQYWKSRHELPEQPSAGERFEHTCRHFGTKQKLTYTGTRREVKDVLYDFFTTEDNQTVFFSPYEVRDNMVKL